MHRAVCTVQCYIFLLASYVSIVRVWMVTAVSPFCQYSLLVVTVRVTLQEEKARDTVIKDSKVIKDNKDFFFIMVQVF